MINMFTKLKSQGLMAAHFRDSAEHNATHPANWQEDYGHENGQYQNKCFSCSRVFQGHKRRAMCKECASLASERKADELNLKDNTEISMSDSHWPEPTKGFLFKRNDLVNHYKGGKYAIMGTPDEYVIEATREPAYAYRSITYPLGPIVIRSQKEMEDGRFVTAAGLFSEKWVAKIQALSATQ